MADWYVDPTNGTDGGGTTGTSGDPYASIQYCLTNAGVAWGDTIYLANTSADSISSDFDFSALTGTASDVNQLLITGGWDNGGSQVLTFGGMDFPAGQISWDNNTIAVDTRYVSMAYIEFTNFANNGNSYVLANDAVFYRCKISGTNGSQRLFRTSSTGGRIVNCVAVGDMSNGFYMNGGGFFAFNYCLFPTSNAFRGDSGSMTMIGNIAIVDGHTGVDSGNVSSIIVNNLIINAGTQSGSGMLCNGNSAVNTIICNNHVHNFSTAYNLASSSSFDTNHMAGNTYSSCAVGDNYGSYRPWIYEESVDAGSVTFPNASSGDPTPVGLALNFPRTPAGLPGSLVANLPPGCVAPTPTSGGGTFLNRGILTGGRL